MKRLHLLCILVLSLLVLFSFASCKGDDTTAPDTTDTPTTNPPPVTTTEKKPTIENPFTEEDPWDISLSMPNAVLATLRQPGETLFTGLEWTGKVNSKDANGKTVNQSSIVSVNEVKNHTSSTIVYKDLNEAYNASISFSPEMSSYYQLLTGENHSWQLAVYKNENTAQAAGVFDFYKTTYSMENAPMYKGDNTLSAYRDAYYGGFKTVTLPAAWQTQGFDFPIYSNTQYPWDNDAYGNGAFTVPIAPTTTNPVGFYRTYVDVDPEWIASGRRVYISFQGVESAYYLYVNGYEVGYSEDTFDASDFDITPYLNKDGKKNLIAVRVYRWCDGSYFENQDYLRLAGIYRDVYLYSLPGTHIADYQVVTDLDNKFTDANLKLSADIYNSTANDVEAGFYSLDVRLIDAEGNSVFASEPLRKEIGAIKSGNTLSLTLSRVVKEPHLWSDEDPYLYTLLISLYDKNGVYYGTTAQQLGFREITFTKTISTSATNPSYSTILLNGKTLVFKGVNRHDINPETGRYLPKELMEKDVQIMKSLNINAVRTSHYPNDRYFYDMCDKYGILVMGECNIETHYGVNTDQTGRYFNELVKDRVSSFTEAAKNRTCIVMWSIGNETSMGAAVYPSVITSLKKMDPTRPVHFESLGSSGGVDVSSTMYSSIYDVESRGKWENHMPYVLCEYAHAMGNSAGNLYEYWQVFRKYDNLVGAFIWDYVDQSLWTPIPTTYKNAIDYYKTGYFLGYGGTWGDSPNSGNFCQNGIISADRRIQPEAEEVKYVYQSIWFTTNVLTQTHKTLSVYNEYNFTDLSAFDYTYELLANGKVIDSGSFTLSGTPKSTVTVDIPFKLETLEADTEYYLSVYAKLKNSTDYAEKGAIVAKEQFEIYVATDNITPNPSQMDSLSFTENDETITVTGKTFSLTVEKDKGDISNYTVNGETVLTSGPVPNFTRAKNDNDIKTTFDWDNVSVSNANSITVTPDASGKFITIKTELLLSKSAGTEEITYTVYGNGEITVDIKLNPSATMGEMLKFGTVLKLSSDYENITFYGNGPVDTYIDRMRGALKGIYNTTVSDSFYPYPNPQDTGNKTGVQYFALSSTTKKTGVIVVAATELEASALHYSVAQMRSATYTYNIRGTAATYLNVDMMSRGTGGASCGPDTLSQYRLYNDGRDYAYSYTIVPFDKSSVDYNEIYRTWHDTVSRTQADIDKHLASLVDNAISALASDPDNVKEVRAAYNALTDAQKALIKNLTILETVEKGGTVSIIFKDQSPNANTAKFENGLLYEDATSPTGYAIDGYFFSGDIGGKINRAISGTANFTFGAYVRMDDLNADNVILAKGDTQVTIKIDSSGRLEFFVYRGNWDAIITVNPATAGLAVDQWAYVVGVREGNMLRLYVNGKLVGTASNASGSITSNSDKLGIGVDPTHGRYNRGEFAYAHILPYAASAEDIAATYEALKNGTTPAYGPEDAVVWYDSSKFEYQ
ncbi:MAG: DUF4981 domain-containing protein [Clostridia bacterium]|nr:DUF4981 domain-containing protein [Clostridia bacterium]